MGKKTAELLAKNGYVYRRPISDDIEETSGSKHIGAKRIERDWEMDDLDKEEYVSAEMAGRRDQKRKVSRRM